MSTFRRTAVLALVVLLTVGAILLGRWQLQRLDDRRAINVERIAALEAPPIAVGPGTTEAEADGRRITIRGEFDPGVQVLLRGRVHRSAPGLHVVTAFRGEGGGPLVWVLRGFVYTPDGVTPPAIVPPPAAGVVTVDGIAYRLPETDNGGQPIDAGAQLTYRRLDRAALHARLPQALDLYVIEAGDEAGPGRLPTAEPPVLDDGPHLSYALQWFGIALAVAAFGIIVVRRDGRVRPPRPSAP
ncbi:MAG: SURF1 family protein [Gemmatimonadales bacterium]|nr:SURF1 family protein [Gemmatimonadales bacterium]